MKRSVQEIVELLVFGLIALLIGTGLLWLAGWIFDLVGVLFKFFAALIWSLLRFIVPVAVGAAIVYALVRLIQQQRDRSAAEKSATASGNAPSPSPENQPPPLAQSSEGNTPAGATPSPKSAAGEEPLADGSEEGESHPRSSEVWTPPQPSPPTNPEPAEDPDRTRPPVGQEPADEEATGSALPADDTAPARAPLAEPGDDERPVEGRDDLDEGEDDEHRS